jgi:hypothetical protein
MDENILDYARAEGRVVCTLDTDLHALLAVSGSLDPSVIRPRRFLVWLQDRDGERALAYGYFTHFLRIKAAGHGQILADAESPEPGACE